METQLCHKDGLLRIAGEKSWLNLRLHGKAGGQNSAPAPVERKNICIAHALDVVGRERRTEPASTIKHKLRAFVRDCVLNIALDHASSEMHCSPGVAGSVFAVFADIDKLARGAGFEHLTILIDCNFRNSR